MEEVPRKNERERSSRPEVFCRKGSSQKFRKIHRKTPVPECLFSACDFIKKETLAQVFCCEFAKLLKRPFLIGHLRWLLLKRRDGQVRNVGARCADSRCQVRRCQVRRFQVSGVQVSDARYQVSGAQVSGARCQVSGANFKIPEICKILKLLELILNNPLTNI